NTAYFLTLRQWQREQLRRRRLLVIDEAHNLEAQLVRVFTVAFAPDQMKAWFGGALPRFGSADDYRILFEDHVARLDAALVSIDPRLFEEIVAILGRHRTEKGLVHAASYAAARRLLAHLADRAPAEMRRVIFVESSEAKARALEHHRVSPLPTVLLSPSLREGV